MSSWPPPNEGGGSGDGDEGPTYCDRIVHRFETLTGKQAKLATTAESFEEAADARLLGILSLNDKEEVQ